MLKYEQFLLEITGRELDYLANSFPNDSVTIDRDENRIKLVTTQESLSEYLSSSENDEDITILEQRTMGGEIPQSLSRLSRVVEEPLGRHLKKVVPDVNLLPLYVRQSIGEEILTVKCDYPSGRSDFARQWNARPISRTMAHSLKNDDLLDNAEFREENNDILTNKDYIRWGKEFNERFENSNIKFIGVIHIPPIPFPNGTVDITGMAAKIPDSQDYSTVDTWLSRKFAEQKSEKEDEIPKCSQYMQFPEERWVKLKW